MKRIMKKPYLNYLDFLFRKFNATLQYACGYKNYINQT